MSKLVKNIQNLTEYESLFITGTDTEIGKTYCTSLLLRFMMKMDIDVNPFKPIAAGTEAHLLDDEGNSVNEDTFRLWQASNKRFTMNQINPILYDQPIAPHIAADLECDELSQKRLDALLPEALNLAELTLIEGAGGWHLPLNNEELLSQWVAKHKIPVIMVVGVRLGCLNHALLTAQAITSTGCEIVGWVANYIEGKNDIHIKNVDYLKQKLLVNYGAECLFEVDKNQTSLG
ncbi:dethiobiotin synthase [Psychrosphaera haliotis]|uniref:dethiobiotin synthase n=1 Tax=Psychrosphaera haliotis TaxID=555083 RepID=UPI0031CEF1BB